MSDAEAAAALLVDIAESLDAALTVPHSPIQEAMRRAMDAPRPGDLVVVMAVRRRRAAPHRVGHYVGSYDDVVAREDDGTELRERGFTIRLLDGSEIDWTNAHVVRVGDVYCAARDALDTRRSPAPAEPSST